MRLFSGNKQLPALPVIYGQLSQMLDNPFASNRKIASLIMKDQAMVAKILKLSNSAMYSKRQEITNLANAITFLGLETLKNLILQISLVRVFPFENENIPEFKISTFWEHSLSTAYFATILAKKLNIPANDNFYLGGLLHDIGKLVIYQYHPDKFEEIILRQIEKKQLDYVAEEEVLGVNHTDIGVFFAENWKFKPPIVAAIGNHHQQRRSLALHVAIVRVANLFSKAAGLCFPWDHQLFEMVDDPTWESLTNYAPNDVNVETIIEEIMEEADKVKESVSTLLDKSE